MVIKNGWVLCEDRGFHKMNVATNGGMITALDVSADDYSESYDAQGCYVSAGLVDIHTHGCLGADFSDGVSEDWKLMSSAYARHGTTAFLATTMTLCESSLAVAMDAAKGFVRPDDGARCLGVNLEGPFLSYAKRGAQAAEHLHRPDASMLRRLNARSGDKVRLVTVAPEEPGAAEFIRDAKRICAVALGHSTADYDTATAAFEAGADHVTHLFNAMPPLLHRQPGLIGAAVDTGAWAELICDGLHVHACSIRCAQKLFEEKLLLISDSIRCTGLADGAYSLGGQPVTLSDGRATLCDKTLAGGSVFLMRCIQKAIEFGIAPQAAIYAATAAPADSVGLGDRAGRILPGRDADILVLDANFRLKQVFIGGNPIL